MDQESDRGRRRRYARARQKRYIERKHAQENGLPTPPQPPRQKRASQPDQPKRTQQLSAIRNLKARFKKNHPFCDSDPTEQQERLLHDTAADELRAKYTAASKAKKKTYLKHKSGLGLRILRARAAKPDISGICTCYAAGKVAISENITGNAIENVAENVAATVPVPNAAANLVSANSDSANGVSANAIPVDARANVAKLCHCEKNRDPDYLLMDEAQHLSWAESPTSQIVVIRDRKYFQSCAKVTEESALEALELHGQGLTIDIQELQGVRNKEDRTIRRPVQDALKKWRNSKGKITNTDPPLNFLNLRTLEPRPPPKGLSKHFTLLDRAASASLARDSSVGKQGELSATDIISCINFTILAQSGSISGWHMDNLGVWTWMTLEADSDKTYEDPKASENVVKLWAVARTDHLTPEELELALGDFENDIDDWEPPATPALKVAVISLVCGDTLIMPPGTLHAPISKTNCLLRGGMCMHPKMISESMKWWKWLGTHENATNEGSPNQTAGVVAHILKMVEHNPAEHCVTDLEAFRQTCADRIDEEKRKQ